MSKNTSSNQKSTPKAERTNTGKRGSKKIPLSNLNQVLMGKGQFKTLEPIKSAPWRGTEIIGQMFDAKQSKINKELGYW